MEKIRYGIIGLGNQGTNYAINIFDGGKANDAYVTAMCDINPAKIDIMKKNTANKDVVYFTDYKEMLDSGLCDAVLVEVPTISIPKWLLNVSREALTSSATSPRAFTQSRSRR